MKKIYFMFLMLFSAGAYSQCYVDIESIKAGRVDFVFSSDEKDRVSEYGSLYITVKNDKGFIVKQVNVKPDPQYMDFDYSFDLPKGKFVILVYDFKKNLLSYSDVFIIQ